MTEYSDIETNYSGNYKKMDMKKTKVALVTASLLALLSGCNDNSSSPPPLNPRTAPSPVCPMCNPLPSNWWPGPIRR